MATTNRKVNAPKTPNEAVLGLGIAVMATLSRGAMAVRDAVELQQDYLGSAAGQGHDHRCQAVRYDAHGRKRRHQAAT